MNYPSDADELKAISEELARAYGPEFGEEAWRDGHEDIGPTGPYAPREALADDRAIPSVVPPLRRTPPDPRDALLIGARVNAIAGAVMHTLLKNRAQVEAAKLQMADWMIEHAPVRFLGAGRALLAAAMPGNRLAHAGAQVSFMGGMVPLPNSCLGGGIIACSASGKTKPVLEAMAIAKRNNPEIVTIGIADRGAEEFRNLCNIFIGLHYARRACPNPLSALADTEEYMIAEILDGLVVLAGKHIGFNDAAWRRGHEDIGPTGPYAPKGTKA